VAVVTVAGMIGLCAGPASTSLAAFVPVCGGAAGEFVYSSQRIQVWAKQRKITVRTAAGAVSLSYSPSPREGVAQRTAANGPVAQGTAASGPIAHEDAQGTVANWPVTNGRIANGTAANAPVAQEAAAGRFAQETTANGTIAKEASQATVANGRLVYGIATQGTLAHGTQPMVGRVNIFKEASSCSALPMFGELSYAVLYPGISLRLQVRDGVLKSEYAVQPGASPVQISMLYSGASATRSARISAAGDLVIGTPHGSWIERRPQAWQAGDSGSHPVSVLWRIRADGTVGFNVGKYNTQQTLVIDPALSFSTYLANATTADHASATGIALDSSGNSYVGGWIESNGLGAPLVGQTVSHGSLDGFLIKCSPAGSIIFATYFGGSGYDQILGVAVDGLNRAWVTGVTSSTDLPMVRPVQGALAGYRNAFVATFSATGTLVFSTYFGGAGPDMGNGIAADSAGNAYVTGDTQSADFPLKQAVQPHFGGVQDVFVAKFSAQGMLTYSTYLGGSDVDHGAAIAVGAASVGGYVVEVRPDDGALIVVEVDSSAAVYVTGATYSRDFPTRSPYQAALNGVGDAFVAKIDGTGANIVYSTYFGGSGGTVFSPEQANAITVDLTGNVYLAGVTSSIDFPTASGAPALTLEGTSDAFVAELDSTGSRLVFSALIGGSGEETATGVAVGQAGTICVTGYTSSFDFPSVAPLQSVLSGLWNAFVTVVNPAGAGFSFSTLLGGSGIDEAAGIAADGLGNLYVVGQAGSADFPLFNQSPLTHMGGFDAFALKISMP